MSLAAAAPAQGSPSIPTLTEPSESEPGTGNATPRATADGEEKKKKRSLFGFGKKKTDETAKSPPAKPTSPVKNGSALNRATTASPIQTDHPHFSPSSPGRAAFAASSPRLSSPAGSQIFERDVQESATTLMPNSPAIPSHITTENYIPPVLDASSEAITDDHLDPDNVEIVTHTSHQPASVAVTSSLSLSPGSHNNNDPSSPTWADELAAFSSARLGGGRSASRPTSTVLVGDSASNYGSLDNTGTDIRRLSFISFADVVQAEQQQFPPSGYGNASSSTTQLAGLTSLAISPHNRNRSPSPIRSPVSCSSGVGGGVGSSPPTSKDGSVKGLEMSTSSSGINSRKPLGSPTSMISMQLGGPGQGPGSVVSGELAIETMTQALRRTGSGDFGNGVGGSMAGGGGVRSFPVSPI